MIAQASVQYLPLADNSVDLIFTDPPYLGEFLHTYAWLASEAARVLKPGGFCLTMCGGYYLNQIFRMMDRHLEYHWKLEVLMDHASVLWPRKVIARSKSVLAYSKGKSNPRCNILGALHGGGMDKRYHAWGQDVNSARYYIDCFSQPGDLICDPFIGGGTTAVACELIGRKCMSFDIDPTAIYITRSRLAGADIPYQFGLFHHGNPTNTCNRFAPLGHKQPRGNVRQLTTRAIIPSN